VPALRSCPDQVTSGSILSVLEKTWASPYWIMWEGTVVVSSRLHCMKFSECVLT
jgi:hypothetical protein